MRRYAGTLIMAATLVASSAVAQQQTPSASPGGGKSAGQIDCPAAGAAGLAEALALGEGEASGLDAPLCADNVPAMSGIQAMRQVSSRITESSLFVK